MTPEELLTKHVHSLEWEQIPSKVRDSVSTMLIDTMGVILAGLKSNECQNLLSKYCSWGGAKECSVAGSKQLLPAPSTSFLGGVMAHWWEWDDTHDASAVHASAVIFPALLSAAEAAKKDTGEISGKEFVAASVTAFDVACQIGAILVPHYHFGTMATGVPGHIGAAAGVARIIGLDEDGIMSAMGIAAEQAGLSRQPLADRVNGKNILCGIAAAQGVQSAYAAQAGIIGSKNFLTGKFGLNAIFAEGKADINKGLSDIGKKFSVTEASIKPYPCCRSTHPGLDLTFDMLEEEPDLGKKVKSVEVTSSEIINQLVGAPFSPGKDPRVAAQFSIPYCQSVALKRGRISLDDFNPNQVTSDKQILEFTKNVTVIPIKEKIDGATWWWPHKVKMKLDDGSVREREVKALRGSLARPFLPNEQQEKLEEAGKGVLSNDQLNELANASKNIGKNGIAPVTKIMREAKMNN